jgi:hypothetical protein
MRISGKYSERLARFARCGKKCIKKFSGDRCTAGGDDIPVSLDRVSRLACASGFELVSERDFAASDSFALRDAPLR